MSKIVFLTFNDYPGGIFSGQVVDVCKLLKEQGHDVNLLSFVSLRVYFKITSALKQQFAKSSTLYMSPGVENWKRNANRLKRRIKKLNPETIIARGPFATWLALECREAGLVKRVVFDGRGAYEAEFKEYNVAGSEFLNREIRAIEERSVSKSDFRIAVSKALVQYWRREYAYEGTGHVVIPCTIREMTTVATDRSVIRSRYGFSEDDIVIVYSGSAAGWQSYDLLSNAGEELMNKNPNARFLILAPDVSGLGLISKFPDKVKSAWVSAAEVVSVLSACDYGWLVRENSVTNQVASPVKFAEYLHSGLSVLISEGLGDFSAFTKKHQCGHVVEDQNIELKRLSDEGRLHNRKLAAEYFMKRNYLQQYKLVAG